jgi:hypothetical protein
MLSHVFIHFDYVSLESGRKILVLIYMKMKGESRKFGWDIVLGSGTRLLALGFLSGNVSSHK